MEGCGLACCAVSFSDYCEVMGVRELCEFSCFSLLLVDVIADEPLCVPSGAFIVAVVLVSARCVRGCGRCMLL